MVTNQAYLFLIFTIAGVVIGLLFDIFRILRKSFKTKDIVTYIEDALFWILTGIILLYTIFTFSNGEIRFYMFVGVFIGCILYMLMFSKYFININVKIINILKKVFFILVIPIKIIFKFISKVMMKITKKINIGFFKKIKKITKNTNFLKKIIIISKNKKEFLEKSRNI